jgi:DNA polymerase bacteriophage-type
MANGRIVSNSGRGVQLQNLPRPLLKQKDIDFGIEAMLCDSEELFYDDVMGLCASAVRGCIVADTGRKLCVSDLANIEGRKAAWLAGESWKLTAFRAYDAGTGPDLYKVSYAGAFKIRPEEVDKGAKSGPQRQIGKVMELMLQYQGGVAAYLTGAATYGIDLTAMAKLALPLIPPEVIDKAQWWWEESIKRKQTYELERDVFVACDGLKRLWRKAHPKIESMWEDLENAARNAIESKNKTYTCRKLSLIRTGNWLRVILPSGFYLCYAAPKVKDSGEISYMGMNQYTRKWSRIKTYGGKFFEQATQASSRDIMAWNMPAVEDAGYPIVTHTHDELVTEPLDEERYTPEDLSKLLATNPSWALDLPLAASGFESYRYRKSD